MQDSKPSLFGFLDLASFGFAHRSINCGDYYVEMRFERDPCLSFAFVDSLVGQNPVDARDEGFYLCFGSYFSGGVVGVIVFHIHQNYRIGIFGARRLLLEI